MNFQKMNSSNELREGYMDKKCVSVIVPIYNGEKYIGRCIESIQRQTYTNLEIILVNDGSKDSSGLICNQYAERDRRIKVYHVKNQGVSRTRNYGLGKATGTYIQFVDSDDYLSRHATKSLVDTIEKKHVDLVVCRYIRLLKKLHLYGTQIEKTGFYTNKQYLINTLRDPGHHYYGVVWNKLFRREIIEKYHIRFYDNANLGEDFIFNLQYLRRIKLVLVMKDHLYYYRCDNENTLSRYEKSIQMCKRELNNRYLIFGFYKEAFIDVGLYDTYKDKVQQYWLMYFARNLYYLQHEFSDWREEDITEWSNILYESKEIQNCIKNIPKKHINRMIQKIYFRRILASRMKMAINNLERIRHIYEKSSYYNHNK